MNRKFWLKALVGISMISYLANPLTHIVQPVVTLAQTTGTTELVSISSTGELGNHSSGNPSISSDGRFVAFVSYASNLVDGDTNGKKDIFVRDRQLGITERVSVSSMGEQGNFDSESPSISADGRFVVFSSKASNLVEGDTNLYLDVFVHDRETSETERVSVSSSGNQGTGGGNYYPSISSDGRFVVFSSNMANLVNGKTRSDSDVFIHDRQIGLTERISVSPDGEEGNKESRNSSISADGRFVVFGSLANNLIIQDTNQGSDIFIRDQSNGDIELISKTSSGEQANGSSQHPSISADGQVVAFVSTASNLANEESNDLLEIFLHDRQTGVTKLISVSSEGRRANDFSQNPSISADGHMVAFESFASNLVVKDKSWGSDIFVHNRQTGETERISVSISGEDANGSSSAASISANGCLVTFQSEASNLVKNDTNLFSDIFVRNRCIGEDNTLLPGEGTSEIIGQILPAVTDLKVIPISKSTNQGSNIKFSWIVPEISEQNNVSIKYFDLRYSHDPITEGNWQDAVQIEGEIKPNETKLEMTPINFEISESVRYYFALKSVIENGTSSIISNVISYIDTGFRSDINGFIFMNGPSNQPDDTGWGYYPDPPTIGDFTLVDTFRLFGLKACNIPNPVGDGCLIYTSEAKEFHEQVNLNTTSVGHCVGMAVGSQKIYETENGLSLLNLSAEKVFSDSVSLDLTRRYITYEHVKQATLPLLTYRADKQINSVLIQELGALTNALRNNEQVIIELSRDNAWHAVTPIALMGGDNGSALVYIYNNNYPGIIKTIEINLSNNAWKLHDYPESNNPHTLYIIPLELFNGPFSNPHDGFDIIFASQQQGHLLITNNEGEKLGYVNGSFVSEIPGGGAAAFSGEFTSQPEPIFYIPKNNELHIELRGHQNTSEEKVSISHIVSNIVLAVENISLSASTRDTWHISPDGEEISYEAGEKQTLDFRVNYDWMESSYEYIFQRVDLESGQKIKISVNPDIYQIGIRRDASRNDSYDLSIIVQHETGEQIFTHHSIMIAENQSHLYDLSTGISENELVLQLDNQADGTVDSTVTLMNEVNIEVKSDRETPILGKNINIGRIVLLGSIVIFLLGVIGVFVYIWKRNA